MSEGLKCPACGSIRHYVTNSRPRETTIHRRRKCRPCGERFSTWEFTEADVPTMQTGYRSMVESMRAAAMKIVQRCDKELEEQE